MHRNSPGKAAIGRRRRGGDERAWLDHLAAPEPLAVIRPGDALG
jgi:hypothetical protein